MESDERFKHLATDPRFKTLRKPQRKIQIDSRFQSMFTDEKFTLKYSKDKRGRKQNKTSGDDLKKYYHLNERHQATLPADRDGHDSDDDDSTKLQQKTEPADDIDDDEVTDVEEQVSSEEADERIVSEDEEDEEEEDDDDVDCEDEDEKEDEEEEEESELSSSSDESESEADEEQVDELDMVNINYDWQPLDHDAETADVTTRRLAIQNLDWDRLDVRDIYTLVNSIRPPIRVRIYVSEFGKERLKQEELEGPKELAEMPKVDEDEKEYQQLKDKMQAIKNPATKKYKVNEYEDADEEFDPRNEEIRERIRRYQLSRMKYYYAIAEFDSAESAEAVYKGLDGMEYEGSSLELDLRFVPDDVDFDSDDIKSECDKMPDLASYKAPQFINSALQQTTVKFTWDETDIKRQDKLHRAYTKEELEKDDLDAYLASETESEADELEEEDDDNDGVSVVTANSEARVNKYKLLLKSLEEEVERKKKVDVDVEWGSYDEDEENGGLEGEGDTGDLPSDSGDDDDDDSDSALECQPESDTEEQDMRVSRKKAKDKGKKERKRKSGKMNDKKGAKSTGGDDLSDADEALDLLVMDADRKPDEFKFNPEDNRFKAVYESGLYNIDPSHPNFKRTQAFDLMAEKKREKRQKTSS